MSSVILSRPSSVTDKVLRRADYGKERNGLETLTELYTIRTAARISIQPARDATHSSYTESALKYPRMQVETVSFREIDGDLTEMSVTYVGLTSSSGLPPALVRIIPANEAGIFGPDINIEAEFVSDSSEVQILDGRFSSSQPVAANPFSYDYKKMPPSINGTILPSDPRQPYVESTTTIVTRYYGYVLTGLNTARRGSFLVATAIFAEKLEQGAVL